MEYGYLAKNHIVPYIGHLRIGEVNRETFFNLLVNALPAEEASQITIRATRKVLSAMCQMAFDEGYRDNNPIRSIRLKHAPAKSVLVASHDQWRRLEERFRDCPACCGRIRKGRAPGQCRHQGQVSKINGSSAFACRWQADSHYRPEDHRSCS